MKTQLQAQLLRHFSKKNKSGGFTLIELLVVIIIIGILSAIALPAFLNQANKARQSEAKTYIGSMNRAQQAYYLENSDFVTTTANFDDLGLGIPRDTGDYDYSISYAATTPNIVTNQAAADDQTSVKDYVGGVEVTSGTTQAILCEEIDVAAATPANGSETVTALPTCPTAYNRLGQ